MISSRFLAAILLPALVLGHSWVDCTDYAGVGTSAWSTNIERYNRRDCRGFPRDYTTFNGGPVFGNDRGYNYQARGGARACVTNLTPGSYNAEFPKARYTGGERIRVLWPAKNHDAGSRCTNPFIPDTTMKLFRICGAARDRLAPNFNPTVDQVLASELVVDWKQERRPAYGANKRAAKDEDWAPGFQNCPFFCDNTDKAVCFQEFNVPNVASQTECTYIWYWVFNNGDAPYLTCFDATIVPGNGEVGRAPAPAPGPAPGPAPRPAPGPAPAPRPPAGGNCAAHYAQCGGEGWRGATCCQSGLVCKPARNNKYYHQCLTAAEPAPNSVEVGDSAPSAFSSGVAGVAGFFVGGVLAVAAVAVVAVVVLRKRAAVAKTPLETELVTRS